MSSLPLRAQGSACVGMLQAGMLWMGMLRMMLALMLPSPS